jgi:hypothetical protein
MYRTGPNHVDNPLEYRAWTDMKTRCFNPNFKDFRLYGGRGITVCDRWRQSFVAFYSDMGSKPSPDHSLDRIKTDGNYEPENCRWATAKEQARNWGSRNRLIAFEGRVLPLSQWAEEIGISREALRDRLDAGWTIKQALTMPPVRSRERLEDGTFAKTIGY